MIIIPTGRCPGIVGLSWNSQEVGKARTELLRDGLRLWMTVEKLIHFLII